MNARQQFHCARRLGPLFGELITLAPRLMTMTPDGMSDPLVAKSLQEAIEAFAGALAKIPDADCDYVLDRCMEVTQRLSGGNGHGMVWADVWSERAHKLMFDDIDMAEMIRIASEVMRDNLSGFFSTPPTVGDPTTTGPQPPTSAFN
jgi:hypothetical protein